MASLYEEYRPEVEQLIDDEQPIIAAILASMQRLSDRTHALYGQRIRVSHGKSHGVAVGELTVLDNLPTHLAQGPDRSQTANSEAGRVQPRPAAVRRCPVFSVAHGRTHGYHRRSRLISLLP